MTTLPVDRLERMPIMQKYHIAYGIRNNVLGMSIVMVQYVTIRKRFKYHRSGIYCIDQGDARSNTFYGIDEGSIFYLRLTSSKARSLFFLSFFGSGLRDSLACSLLGGVVPIPEQRLWGH